jgi:hypothetical protein
LGLIREKLVITQGSTIAMNGLAMNLQKLLELHFVLIGIWIYFLLGGGEVLDRGLGSQPIQTLRAHWRITKSTSITPELL